MALIYPGIWGVLQPVTPRVGFTTSLLFPYVLNEQLTLPQPTITQVDSFLRVSQYSYSFGDALTSKKITINPASSLDVTIRYQTYSFGDPLTSKKIVINPASSLITTIAYQTTAYNDILSLLKPSVTGSLTVVVNYVNTSMTDNLPMRKPTFTNASTLA